MTEIVSIDRDGAAAARAALERTIAAGGVAVFPADGLYGLACDPLDAAAIERIHGSRAATTASPRRSCTSRRWRCASWSRASGRGPGDAVGALLPGPVTLVVANPQGRYPLACREDPRPARRPPDRRPARRARCARSSRPRPTSAASRRRRASSDVPAEIVAAADLAIDGGELTGLPSTVVDLTGFDAEGELDRPARGRALRRAT